MDLDGCPSPEEEPLSAAEWRVYADWCARCPTIRSMRGVPQMVRRAYVDFDQAVALLLARDPNLSLPVARKRCHHLIARPPGTTRTDRFER